MKKALPKTLLLLLVLVNLPFHSSGQIPDLKGNLVGAWNRMEDGKNKKIMRLTLHENGTYDEFWYKEGIVQGGTWVTSFNDEDEPTIEFTVQYESSSELKVKAIFSILPGKIMVLDGSTYKPAKGKGKS